MPWFVREIVKLSCLNRTYSRQFGQYLQEIVNWVQTAKIPILEVDGSLTVEENAEKIVNWIVSQLGDRYEE